MPRDSMHDPIDLASDGSLPASNPPSWAATRSDPPDSAREIASLQVTSPAFDDGASIPPRHAAEQNVSPPLEWSGVPEGTRELALLVEDPDAPGPRPFVHWAAYGIPHTVTQLSEGIGTGVDLPTLAEGMNSRGGRGFFGPSPPAGGGPHRYAFQIFALDAPLGLASGVDRDALVRAMTGHVIGYGRLMATYENR
jgi:Raf kinase inhibitor-like YbhB/YbcL family protein